MQMSEAKKSGESGKPFWQTKALKEMSEEEWEMLCDGCGRCCYEKMLEGHGKKTKIYFTRIACNLLDLETQRCGDYCNRFQLVKDCNKLSVKNLESFTWLPETCAYRLLFEGKNLPDWHPLVSGRKESVKESGVQIKNGIHEKDAGSWEDYVI